MSEKESFAASSSSLSTSISHLLPVTNKKTKGKGKGKKSCNFTDAEVFKKRILCNNDFINIFF